MHECATDRRDLLAGEELAVVNDFANRMVIGLLMEGYLMCGSKYFSPAME